MLTLCFVVDVYFSFTHKTRVRYVFVIIIIEKNSKLHKFKMVSLLFPPTLEPRYENAAKSNYWTMSAEGFEEFAGDNAFKRRRRRGKYDCQQLYKNSIKSKLTDSSNSKNGNGHNQNGQSGSNLNGLALGNSTTGNSGSNGQISHGLEGIVGNGLDSLSLMGFQGKSISQLLQQSQQQPSTMTNPSNPNQTIIDLSSLHNQVQTQQSGSSTPNQLAGSPLIRTQINMQTTNQNQISKTSNNQNSESLSAASPNSSSPKHPQSPRSNQSATNFLLQNLFSPGNSNTNNNNNGSTNMKRKNNSQTIPNKRMHLSNNIQSQQQNQNSDVSSAISILQNLLQGK